MSALAILAEAALRAEAKLDELLRRLQFLDQTPYTMMHFAGQACPMCKQAIDYQINIQHNVVTRKCGCKTGKLPPTIPLIPAPGVQNGNPASGPAPTEPSEGGGFPPNRPRRQGG